MVGGLRQKFFLLTHHLKDAKITHVGTTALCLVGRWSTAEAMLLGRPVPPRQQERNHQRNKVRHTRYTLQHISLCKPSLIPQQHHAFFSLKLRS